jgi:hypothetical protein
MSTKRSTLTIVFLCLLLVPAAAWAAGSDPTVVTINAVVDEVIAWDSATQTVNIAGHIVKPNDPQSEVGTFTLYTNTAAAVTITPTSAAGTPNWAGVLTKSAGVVLTTKYGMDGDLTNGDGAGVTPFAAAAFVGVKTYTLDNAAPHANGTYSIELNVEASAVNSIPAFGAYSCTVTLTASF